MKKLKTLDVHCACKSGHTKYREPKQWRVCIYNLYEYENLKERNGERTRAHAMHESELQRIAC